MQRWRWDEASKALTREGELLVVAAVHTTSALRSLFAVGPTASQREKGTCNYQLLSAFNTQRCLNPAISLGLAEGAFTEALAYARNRTAFGRSIGEFQGMRWKLADMWREIEAARGLLYRACASAPSAPAAGCARPARCPFFFFVFKSLALHSAPPPALFFLPCFFAASYFFFEEGAPRARRA